MLAPGLEVSGVGSSTETVGDAKLGTQASVASEPCLGLRCHRGLQHHTLGHKILGGYVRLFPEWAGMTWIKSLISDLGI
jgi:hypothetical protein